MIRHWQYTSPEAFPHDGTEGQQAAWWRERKLGLGRAKLGAIVGVTRMAIYSYETGRTPIPPMYRLALGALLAGVSFNWRVLGIVDPAEPVPDAAETPIVPSITVLDSV